MSSEPSVDLLVGKVLEERYRIERKLGQGGMGAVYLGEHVLTKRKVAVKVLVAGLSGTPEVLARFVREAQSATAIGHPNIVEVLDMGRIPSGIPGDPGSLYMVLEFLEGRDLWDLTEAEGVLPIGRAVRIVVQLADALHAAHEKGIVHRDVKPENVYLVKRGAEPDFVKVLDFGISKVTSDEPGGRSMTHTGSILGTPYYLSPEQAHGRKDVDRRADIYAVGVVLFRILAGQFPFEADSFPMLIVKICTEPPPSPRSLRPDLPEALEQVILRCLDKAPERRFATAAELARALEPFATIAALPERARMTDPMARTAAQTGPITALPSALAAASTPPTRAYEPSEAPRSSAVALPVEAPRRDAPSSVPTETPYGTASTMPLPPKSAPPWIAIGLAAVSVAVIGVGYSAFGSTHGDASSGDAGAIAAATAPPEAAPALIRIRITTTPARATLTLDGLEVPNPYDAELPASRESHTISASAPGHLEASRIVAFTETRDLALELAVDPTAPVVGVPATPEVVEVRERPSSPRRPPEHGDEHGSATPDVPEEEVAVRAPDGPPTTPDPPREDPRAEGEEHALKTIRLPR